MAFDSNKAKMDFRDTKLDRIEATVPKGKKAILQEIAIARETSVNKLIIEALEAYLYIDLKK